MLSGSVVVMVNGQTDSYFKIGRCLRQRDPLSLILFNTVIDVLQELVSRAKFQ